MRKLNKTSLKVFIIVIFLSMITFAIDLNLSLGVAGGVPHVAAVLASLWFYRQRSTYLVAVACTILTILGYFWSPPGGIQWVVLTNRFIAIAAVWATAILGLQRKKVLNILNDQTKEFSRKLLSMREAEKKTLANNLHDEVGSLAVVMSANLTIAEKKIKENDTQGAQESIGQAKRELKKEVEILKKIAVDLRPPNIDTVGLSGALREYFSHVTTQVDLKIEYDVNINEAKINDDISITLYRISQEAINNIIKYAETKKVKFGLYGKNGQIRFDIHDEGKGFDMKKEMKNTKIIKMGIRGMKERIEALGGEFSITSALEKGTKIEISLPIKNNAIGVVV